MDVDEGKQEFDAATEEKDREEAPYAYDGDSAADESAAVQGRISNIEMIADQTDVNHRIVKAAINPDVDDEEMTAVPNQPGRPKPLKSGRKKIQHSQTRGLQDGALKSKQSSMTNCIQKGARDWTNGIKLIKTKVQKMVKALHADTYRDMVAASPDSQESVDPYQGQDYIIGETKRGTADEDRDLPVQLGQWLHSFDGEEVSVRANGRRAFLALYASMTSQEAPALNHTSGLFRSATQLNKDMYSLMMYNLRVDVELGLVKECATAAGLP
ncbi:unnamed protein product [Phytophthora fragariaefolia]|uniref:Unnamed protein product n=1 Tax=Phytophthora fragariaefolia TaxID=1490495 RepID=A0A9W7CQG4_9STRA|nr:unnamed protein product [Phytophthora fragariaefolia]